MRLAYPNLSYRLRMPSRQILPDDDIGRFRFIDKRITLSRIRFTVYTFYRWKMPSQ
jgi:hypothetical protein